MHRPRRWPWRAMPWSRADCWPWAPVTGRWVAGCRCAAAGWGCSGRRRSMCRALPAAGRSTWGGTFRAMAPRGRRSSPPWGRMPRCAPTRGFRAMGAKWWSGRTAVPVSWGRSVPRAARWPAMEARSKCRARRIWPSMASLTCGPRRAGRAGCCWTRPISISLPLAPTSLGALIRLSVVATSRSRARVPTA